MADPVLVTRRLELRRIVPGDIDLQMEHLNTPTVMAHLGGVKTREQIAEKHAKTNALFEREGFGFMMMFERATGQLAGHCGLKRVDHPHAPNPGDHEIGWLVREDRWRLGFAEEAMRAVISWAFESIKAPFLVALTSEANAPSWRLMQKLGMERRKDLDFEDPTLPRQDNQMIQYALTHEQWEQAR